MEFLNRKHIVFYTLLRPLVILFLKIRFNFRYKVAKDLPEKYIVLSNHATDYDMLLVGASFRRQMYFVGSEHIARWKVYPLLKFAFAPIIRHKGAPATSAIMEMLRKVRQGANVCMFAESVRTWDGRTCPILPATAKLIKTAGCGLVTYRLTGGYFASPMWCGAGVRRGPVRGEPVRVLTAEQLKALSADEIYRIITEDLYEDAYARQLEDPKAYKGKDLAKGMEQLIFRCPQCGGTDCFHTSGNDLICDDCGLKVTYDTYGMLSGCEFGTLREFSDWQKTVVARDLEEDRTYSAENATLIQVEKQQEILLAQGSAAISREKLTCGDQSFALSEIADLAMHGQRSLVFTVKGKYYELKAERGNNMLKFLLFFDSCKEQQKEKVG